MIHPFDGTIAVQRPLPDLATVFDACLDPEEVLRRSALAMEAGGIRFTLRLLDADGVARVTYESDR